MIAPPEYKALHPIGAAPIITDGDLLLAESNAIVDYIIAKHGNGRLAVAPTEPNYPEYLYWLHFVNGTLQTAHGRNAMLKWGGVPTDGPFMQAMNMRLDQAVSLVDTRLTKNPYLAGSELTAADIMMVFTLTTMRYFTPFDLAPYPHILSYLQRIGQRPVYQSAM